MVLGGAVLATLGIGLVLTADPTAGAPDPGLAGNVVPRLDAVPTGTVGVAAAAAPVDGKVAIIVQNGTASPVDRVRVRGTTAAPDGAVVHSRTNTLVPAVLAPGAYGLAALDFKRDSAPGASVSLDVKSSRSKSAADRALLAVGAFDLSAPLAGPSAQRLDLTVINPRGAVVHGPFSVTVMCFTEAARPAVVATSELKLSRLGPGKSVAMSVPLEYVCPTYLVGARAA